MDKSKKFPPPNDFFLNIPSIGGYKDKPVYFRTSERIKATDTLPEQ
jgi:hypothetical protein